MSLMPIRELRPRRRTSTGARLTREVGMKEGVRGGSAAGKGHLAIGPWRVRTRKKWS